MSSCYLAVLLLTGHSSPSPKPSAPDTPPAPAIGQKSSPEPAAKAARAWQELIDAGKLDESYQQLADSVKETVAADEWILTLARAGKPTEPPVQRRMVQIQPQASLPGQPH